MAENKYGNDFQKDMQNKNNENEMKKNVQVLFVLMLDQTTDNAINLKRIQCPEDLKLSYLWRKIIDVLHMNVTYNNDSFAPGRLMDKVQQSIVHLRDKAKSKIGQTWNMLMHQ
eukprot:1063215-Ditylum_brightwellii.AAC.1